MPDPAFNEEQDIRENSLDIIATNRIPSYQSCSRCLGPNRTPTVHTGCAVQHDSTREDKGKAVIDEDKTVNLASTSTSSAAEKQENGSLASSSQQEPELTDLVAALSLQSVGNEIPANAIPAEGNAAIEVVLFGSDFPGALDPNSNISSSAANKGKRKAEEKYDGSEAPAKFIKIPAMSDTEARLLNREQKLFRDMPDQAGTSSGIGQYMSLQLMQVPEQSDVGQQEEEPAEETFAFVPLLVTYRVPTFAFDFSSHVIMPILEEYQVEDHEELGFDGLLRGDREDIMDDQ